VHRRYLVEVMQQWTKLKDGAGDDVGFVLVVDAELFRLDSVVRWLDSAEGRLRRSAVDAATGPAPGANVGAKLPGAPRRVGGRR
jgi:hypothetical protein